MRHLLFNSAVELGLRALCVLVETHPRSSDLQRLVLFDYLLVHSADVEGGPESLHPATPQRGTEVLVRRAILEPGLALYSRRGLICATAQAEGFVYTASDCGSAFLDTLRAEYVSMLRVRARWISGTFGELQTKEVQHYVNTELDRWGGQFALHAPDRGGS
jgi:hypothetical protein